MHDYLDLADELVERISFKLESWQESRVYRQLVPLEFDHGDVGYSVVALQTALPKVEAARRD